MPSQKAFHNSTARFKGFSGPIGSGKSQALCQEAIKLSYVNPGRMGLIGAPTYPMLRDATQAALFEVLDKNLVPYEHNKAENTLYMKDTRSKIVFRAVDDFERLRGSNLAWFGLDELTYTQEGAWLRLEGRLRDPKARRLCGFAVWTPKGYDWVYEKFLCNRVEGYDAVIAAPFENRHLLEQIPDYYDRLKGSYDDTFYQQEVLGSYLNLSGARVYGAFTRAEHIADLRVDPSRPLLWAMDFNVDPMSSLIVQIVNGTVNVLDEVVIRRATTRDACEEFLKRYPRHEAGVEVFGDASGFHEQTTGASDYRMVREHFQTHSTTEVRYRVPRSNPSVRERVQLTNTKLRSASGEIGLLVDRKCQELIKDFEQVSYKADSNQIDKDRDRRRTHLSDALGYLLWQDCRPLPKIGERQERLI
ncbi:MAG TPA: terminase family protein [Bryobacteraceae bacterium]|nr:terminase family protein [Bryobacteraceae bacterium]